TGISAFPRLPEPARALGPRAPEKKQKKTLAALAPRPPPRRREQLARGDTARLPARGGPSSTARAPRAARGDDGPDLPPGLESTVEALT
ncbi:unnamed protein product, partial [Prorocentrum cordatum]